VRQRLTALLLFYSPNGTSVRSPTICYVLIAWETVVCWACMHSLWPPVVWLRVSQNVRCEGCSAIKSCSCLNRVKAVTVGEGHDLGSGRVLRGLSWPWVCVGGRRLRRTIAQL